jgi:glyoxylase-like metal-dependent hydrolase (beta-lactamase superfamily II)
MLVALSCRAASPDLDVKQIARDVYVASRPDPLRYFVEGNATIIVNEQDVVVVDGGGSPEAGRNLVAAIRKMTSKPVRYLIATHDHVDHNLGNQEFVRAWPGIELISSSYTRDQLATSGRDYVQKTVAEADSIPVRGKRTIDRLTREAKPGSEAVVAYWKRYIDHDGPVRIAQYRKTVITPATLTVDDSLTLHRGRRTIRILHLGAGDTPGDLVIHLPQDRMVCIGDMGTAPVPYGFSEHPFEWARTLAKVDSLAFDQIVPGHGDVQPRAYLHRLIALQQSVLEQVRDARRRGVSADSAAAHVAADAFLAASPREDPVFRYRFENWFMRPHVQQLYDALAEADSTGKAPR